MKTKKEKSKRGGKRKGAGRPRMFNEPTIINFKCELADKLAAKEKHGKQLNRLFVEWIKRMGKVYEQYQSE